MNKFFILHGHFYQPPREDPWWQVVLRQDSAYPYHNWNEKIYWQCYLPNATARVFDPEGRIVDIINNYSYINFNFGPTLLLWLKQNHPDFIQSLKEADLLSQKNNAGHGNAIAQGYNHMILPLANDLDKQTQIYWGKRFFESVFGRETEGMWLPETACNYETLKFLIKNKIKYIILSPYQAERVRKIGEQHWVDVSNGSIDTQRPYRIFLSPEKNEYIDCFFYNAALSHAMSFQHLMHSAQSCADSVMSYYYGGENSLVSVATDGETFGHHHPFSEMGLGYLMKYELSHRGVLCTNFGNFRDKFESQYEVEIKRGSDGLGTSWSCSHGVRRWFDDCGCRIGFYPHWNQKWRKPLRDSLDWLRSELDSIFLKLGSKIFQSPWQARNNFIEVIIDSSDSNVGKFLKEYTFNNSDKIKALKLLEMEHMAMLFYTSCGWFFDEISGIETVQNLKYAARAIQLAGEISGSDLEKQFLDKLALARSNIAKFGNGKGVYESLVKPSIQDWDDYLSSYLIYNAYFKEEKKFYKFDIKKEDRQKIVKAEQSVEIGKIIGRDTFLKEETVRMYLVKKESLEDVECYLDKFDLSEFEELKRLFEGKVWISDKSELSQVIKQHFSSQPWLTGDINSEEREKIIKELFAQRKDFIFESLNKIWQFNLPLLAEYRSVGLRLPYEMCLLGASILDSKIKATFLKFEQDRDFKWLDEIRELLKSAQEMNLELELGEVKEIARQISENLAFQILAQPSSENINILIRFQREMLNLNIDYYTYRVQNIIAYLIKNTELTPELQELARVYSFNSEKFLN